MVKVGGDDLDDDFVPDDLVALSEEEIDEWNGDDSEGDDVQDVGSREGDSVGSAKIQEAAKVEKKRKRREKEKERKAKKRKLVEATEPQQPASIAAQPISQLAGYLSMMQAKAYNKLSAMELDDIRIPENCIADTTIWTSPRTLDQLGDFIAKTLPTLRTRLSQKSKSNGAPTLIFLTGAALRVVDVTRVLKDKAIRGDKGAEVAKLFAKHFKLEEHVAYLKRTKVGAAVGTPGRIGKLLCETDALATTVLTHIMLDVTFRDVKKRSMLDIPETRDEVFKTVLGVPKVRDGLRQGKIQIVLF